MPTSTSVADSGTAVIADERLLELIGLILASHRPAAPSGDTPHAKAAGRGLPIGNLTSQFFANVMLDPFDHFVTEEVRPGGSQPVAKVHPWPLATRKASLFTGVALPAPHP
jgi:hypothetical protein